MCINAFLLFFSLREKFALNRLAREEDPQGTTNAGYKKLSVYKIPQTLLLC
jgi:hypothetical protein